MSLRIIQVVAANWKWICGSAAPRVLAPLRRSWLELPHLLKVPFQLLRPGRAHLKRSASTAARSRKCRASFRIAIIELRHGWQLDEQLLPHAAAHFSLQMDAGGLVLHRHHGGGTLGGRYWCCLPGHQRHHAQGIAARLDRRRNQRFAAAHRRSAIQSSRPRRADHHRRRHRAAGARPASSTPCAPAPKPSKNI